MIALLACIVSLGSSSFDGFRPYAWEASGNQVRMKAIVRALSSLQDRPGRFGRILIRSRIDKASIIVRINRKNAHGRLLLLESYSFFPDARPPTDMFKSIFASAAAGFYATASKSLFDADPRWTSFYVDVEPSKQKGWVWVNVIRKKGNLQFDLARSILLLHGRSSPIIMPSCSIS